jgi:ribosomal protein L17
MERVKAISSHIEKVISGIKKDSRQQRSLCERKRRFKIAMTRIFDEFHTQRTLFRPFC